MITDKKLPLAQRLTVLTLKHFILRMRVIGTQYMALDPIIKCSFIPDHDDLCPSPQDKPGAGKRCQPSGRVSVSVTMPLVDWFCSKVKQMNLHLIQGHVLGLVTETVCRLTSSSNHRNHRQDGMPCIQDLNPLLLDQENRQQVVR